MRMAGGKHVSVEGGLEHGVERGVERGGFLLFLGLVTAALAWVVWPFAAPLLWASLAAIMFQPLYRRMLRLRPGRENQAALLALLVITVAIVIPALIIGSIVVREAAEIFTAFNAGEINAAGWLDAIILSLPQNLQTALDQAGWGDMEDVRTRAQQLAESSVGLIASQAVAIGSGLLGWLLALGVGLYVTYFLLRDGARLGADILRTLPLSPAIATQMGERFLSIVRATIKGTFVVALVQGALGAATFALAGLPSAILFGVLMAFFSLLPAVGPAIVWAPAAIYLLATGAFWPGMLVIGSGVAVIGMADNILRPILVGRDTGIPDWMVLVTTLGGIATFGLSGIVLGPLIAGLFLSAWHVLAEQRAGEMNG